MNLSVKSENLGLTKWVKTFILLLVDLFRFRTEMIKMKKQLKKTERKGETPMRIAKNDDLSQAGKEFSEILDGVREFEKMKKESLSTQAHKIRELRSRCRNVYHDLSKKCREFAGVR